jgi:hypothetical protein
VGSETALGRGLMSHGGNCNIPYGKNEGMSSVYYIGFRIEY